MITVKVNIGDLGERYKQEMTGNKSFLKATAKDYDMETFEVERIYRKCGGCVFTFYAELEIFIEDRKYLENNSQEV